MARKKKTTTKKKTQSRRGKGGGGKGKGKGGGESAFQKRLRKMKEKWEDQKAESASGGGFDFPGDDGRYIAKLAVVELRESSNDNLYAHWEWKVATGEYKGESLYLRHMVEDDRGMTFLQRDLRRLGVDVDEIEIDALEETFGELAKLAPAARLTVKTKGEYQNVYLDKLVEDDELEEEEEEGEEEEEEEEEAGEEEEEAGEEEEEGDETPEDFPQVGDRIWVDEHGEEFVGTIGSIAGKGKKAILVEFDDGDKGNYSEKDIHFVERPEGEEEEEEETEEVKVGTSVAWEDGERTGEIKSIDEKKKTAKVKDDDSGKTVTVKLSELEALVE